VRASGVPAECGRDDMRVGLTWQMAHRADDEAKSSMAELALPARGLGSQVHWVYRHVFFVTPEPGVVGFSPCCS
jgi:hypothetical protein